MTTVRRRPTPFTVATFAVAVLAIGWPLVAAADATPRPLPIEAEQIAVGASAYAASCAACHGAELEGMAHFPELRGAVFRARWSDNTLGELYTYVHDQMPLGAGGSLSDEAYAAIVAFMLARNGVEAGDIAFDPADEEALALPLTF